jgi:hypothetical protein
MESRGGRCQWGRARGSTHHADSLCEGDWVVDVAVNPDHEVRDASRSHQTVDVGDNLHRGRAH